MHWCYVLHSPSVDKFYVGETEDLDMRLNQHNTFFFKGSFTSIATDWILYISLSCENRIHTRKVESFIKQMKSKVFIIKLKENPKIQGDIINRFR
jgi:putative endonuclease